MTCNGPPTSASAKSVPVIAAVEASGRDPERKQRQAYARLSEIEISSGLQQALSEAGHAVSPYEPWARASRPVALLLVLLAIVDALALRPDWPQSPRWLAPTVIAFCLAVFGCGLALVFKRGRAGEGSSRRLRIAFLAAALIVYLAFTLARILTLEGPAPGRFLQVWLQRHFVPLLGAWVRHAPCPLLEIAVAFALLWAILRGARRTASAEPALTAAVCGASAALAASFVVFTFCSSHSVEHIALAHGAPVMPIVSLAVLFGRRVLSP